MSSRPMQILLFMSIHICHSEVSTAGKQKPIMVIYSNLYQTNCVFSKTINNKITVSHYKIQTETNTKLQQKLDLFMPDSSQKQIK